MKRRRGAAVAAALKGKKKGGKKAKKGKDEHNHHPVVHEDDPLKDFLEQNKDADEMFGKRVMMIEKIIAHKNANEKVVLKPTDRKDIMRQRQIDGMTQLVDDRIDRNSNYTACFCLSVFFLLTCSTVILQRRVEAAFFVEGNMLSVLKGDLEFEEYGITRQELTRGDDFYDFIGNIVERTFSDPACGDGVCESPDEFPGFGRFGCIPDCGRYKKTTKATVKMEDFFQYSKSVIGDFHPDKGKASEWDLSVIIDKTKDIHPDYRWNIWSDTMGDYIFAEHQMPLDATKSKEVVDLPDGRFELRMFQYRKVSDEVSKVTIYNQLKMLRNSLPKRTAQTDYAYGDKLEAIAAGAVFMQQVNDYCFGGTADQTPAKCEQIPTVDTMFKALGSYGLAGTITIPNPESKEKPPAPEELLRVGFCGLLKNGTLGLKNRWNKVTLQTAAVDCGARRAMHESPPDASWSDEASQLQPTSRHILEEVPQTSAASLGSSRELLQNVGQPRYGTCVLHSDCDQTVLDAITGEAGQFCHAKWGCDTCSFCQFDGEDAINGLCPQAYCEESGQLPGCLKALRLTTDWSCPDKTEFTLYKYDKALKWEEVTSEKLRGTAADEIKDTALSAAMASASFQSTKSISQEEILSLNLANAASRLKFNSHVRVGEKIYQPAAPEVALPGQAKVRFVTPFNRLIGPIMITQRRRATGNCSKVVNADLKKWAETGLDAGDGCLQGPNDFDGEFYGLDPAFVPSTAVYDGMLIAEDYYEPHERLNKTVQEFNSRDKPVDVTYPSVPIGFYPYKYDLFNHTFRAENTYKKEHGDFFRLYFDTQLSQTQAMSMLDFMKDGGFLDDATSDIQVQTISFNAELNRFTLARFDFIWTEGGVITWDYWVESVVLEPYDLPSGTTQLTLEVIVLTMLGLNVWLELVDILVAVRANKYLEYFTNIGNLFDWLHFSFMGISVYLWVEINRLTMGMKMQEDAYPVLFDPYSAARMFTVDTAKEEAFLLFSDQIIHLSLYTRLYNACAGTAIILFVFRLLKALDFQPIMGIVTRTLWVASSDMAHFIVLFTLISSGFALSGVALFGHQFYRMADATSGFDLQIDILLAMDPGVFYGQMQQAADDFTFQVFLWGWIVVGFFLLINIFISIIIDAYVTCKEANSSKLGMHDDIMMIFQDWYNSMTKKRTQYMPDSTLYAILQEKKMGLPSTYQLREAVLESMEEDAGIVLEGGIIINRHSMRRILRGPRDIEAMQEDKAKMSEEHAEGHLQDSSDDEEEVDWKDLNEETTVEDLMDRYAAGEKGEEEQILDAMKMDSMKRAIALFRHQQWMSRKMKHNAEVCERLALRIVPASKQGAISKQVALMKPPIKDSSSSQSQGLLRVTIVEATNLPKMDLLRASDPYCLVFLTDESGEPGEIVYRTEVILHNSNPVFNEEFLFSLYPGAATVSVLIYDEDCITDDDLIGSCQANLSELDSWVPTELWLQVRNTEREDQGIKNSKMRLQVTLQPANADLGMDDVSSVTSLNELHGGKVKGPASGDLQLLDATQPGGEDNGPGDVEISTDGHPFGTNAGR